MNWFGLRSTWLGQQTLALLSAGNTFELQGSVHVAWGRRPPALSNVHLPSRSEPSSTSALLEYNQIVRHTAAQAAVHVITTGALVAL